MKISRIVAGIALACGCVSLYGATVQGQLTCSAGKSPAVGIAVTVKSAATGRSAPAFSGGDGMYYLNLKAGAYTLEIWLSKSATAPTQTHEITVREPSTDVERIVLPSCSAQ
ncbi:MAG TPA: carboxypeptidase regulatory-like domain-containing protein [Acidobacteriaceae bacterium]|nr:carboxypeptidase regulatory-like domain-containing protein [Acidobacteriaceae bacterium]